ncbi:RAMP superfamily CRISPR-associated protein [Microbispora rosea]|uniref:RAMP superfamily CRISPR-associated protein n=1 Tax=Microbispora rosea TaxID=58117 RepID=UPI00368DBF39
MFHGPFRVATGAASGGVDVTYDPADPLPGSSIKGLMKANARAILKIEESVIGEVYGSATRRSPWWWSEASLLDAVPAVRTRLAIDPATGTAKEKALVTGVELWAVEGWFEVHDRDRIPPDRIELHKAVLTASALAVTAFGSGRRRGLGWVSVHPEHPWDDQQHELLRTCRRNDA